MTLAQQPKTPAADVTGLFERIRFRGHPVAGRQSIRVFGNARFTVLSPRLLRVEWSGNGTFEDRGTFAFPSRLAPAPPFETRVQGRTLHLDTGALSLTYLDDGSPFSDKNLSISLNLGNRRVEWAPFTPDSDNLRGTRRTLDGCAGDASLETGLISRSGWSLYDDSRSVVFDPTTGWVQPRPEHNLQDWYFFGFGHDYKAALYEYRRFGGPIPLIPRFVLGAWWSRYWAYSDQDLRDLVGEFEEHDLPLDVLVVDMDWHTPHAWTGYTWNRELFPDPRAFLAWAHAKGLRVTLNLHPAQGVQGFEEVYPRFAQAMGLDPSTGQGIPFRIADPHFVQNYFELLHHPMEDEGVDFWWLDWQQGETTEIKGLDPLPWLNHLHFSDAARRGMRPMLYSRWGGLGNHRYPIGFSGDTYVTWEALQFQPYMTATASNVAFGWWSHDIGGHMGGATEPELFARWVQFGALSPVLRLHSTKDPRAERRPWKYPEDTYGAAKAAFHLRNQLVPYLYTLARIASDTGISPCRPMYYAYPDADDAYIARYQYLLGDQVIAAPIVHPADPETGLASTDVWVPDGTWIDYQTKETYAGPRWVRLVGDLNRLPMLLRSGSILPLAPTRVPQPAPRLTSGTTDSLPYDGLILCVFPGCGSFRLYEDDGTTPAYQDGEYEWTEFTTSTEKPGVWQVAITATQGRCSDLPSTRTLEIRLEGSRCPHTVLLDGKPHSGWTYEPESLRTVIRTPARDKLAGMTITAMADGPIVAVGPRHNRLLVDRDLIELVGHDIHAPLNDTDPLESLLACADRPGRADAVARLGGPFVRFLEFSTHEEASRSLGRVILAAPANSDEPFDVALAFTLYRGGQREERTLQLGGLRTAQIVDLPYAFDGALQPARWEAQVNLTWRGHTLYQHHHSQPLFPTIPAWQVLTWDQSELELPVELLLDESGPDPDGLAWKPCSQIPKELSSLRQPHRIRFARQFPGEVQAADSPAAYLATAIVSPRTQEARFEFGIVGTLDVYLNGQRVDLLPAVPEPGVPPFFKQPRRTRKLWLADGENWLLLRTEPPGEGRDGWSVVASVTDPEGAPLTNITYTTGRMQSEIRR